MQLVSCSVGKNALHRAVSLRQHGFLSGGEKYDTVMLRYITCGRVVYCRQSSVQQCTEARWEDLQMWCVQLHREADYRRQLSSARCTARSPSSTVSVYILASWSPSFQLLGPNVCRTPFTVLQVCYDLRSVWRLYDTRQYNIRLIMACQIRRPTVWLYKYVSNNNNRLIRRCQNATCYNDMDKTVKKHEMTEVLDC